jgi:hypothetical protein
MKTGKLFTRLAFLCITFLSVQIASAQYNELPSNVKAKMDANKKAGKNIYAGLTRSLNLEVESCGSEEKAMETLKILSELGSYRVEYLSPGRVKIFVDAENDYTRVRDFLFERKIIVRNYYGEEILLKK